MARFWLIPTKQRLHIQRGVSDSVSLVSIGELDDPISQAVYNTLQTLEYDLNDDKELFFTFKHDNQVYHAMFAPFRASYWPWLLGIYVAENDYIGGLKSNRTYSVILSFVLGLIIILIGFLITRSIVFPLKKLQNAAIEVGDGNLDENINIKTLYRELDETSKVFEIMRYGLKEKAKIEDQFQQTQKVESIGRLAGGVAHDLNNLLTPILGYSEILINKLEKDESKKRQVHQIYKAGTKAKDLVHQLLAFSRKQELEYKPLNLNDVVSGFQELLRRTIREDITIDYIESEMLPIVLADQGQIEQVILNLSVNAQDSMVNGGTLTIELSVIDLDNVPENKYHNIKPGQYVLLAISDVGCGIDLETQKHIFEPFFSTKGEFGIGLGLATVYGIVNQHHGDILVYSEPKKGTTFKVYLPLSNEKPNEDVSKTTINADNKGTETILVAEDNAQVMVLTETILKSLGYKVLVAENGSKALDILNDYDEPVHLLLSDVIMPKINGRELYDRAMLIHDELKVLYMSGYADNAIAHHHVIEKGSNFIQKPFSAASLAKKIREVLETN